LDICGGEFPYGNGFLNVDVRPMPKVDIVADITERFPFEDGQVDEIFSCGTLEHFYTGTVIQVLKEMCRVLKPGGLITVGVPNGETILADFKEGTMPFEQFNQYIYGSVQADSNPYNVHRSLWTPKRMEDALKQAGFTAVEEQPYDLPFHLPRYMLKVVGVAP
jgi:predicted SAM-dependent methyltransferase